MITNTARAKSRTVETVHMMDEFVKRQRNAKLEDDFFEEPVIILSETPQL